MEPPKLLDERREYVWIFGALALLFMFHLGLRYQAYRHFVSLPFYFTYAEVEDAYTKTKHDYRYCVVRLRSDEGLHFYTTTPEPCPKPLSRLRLELFPSQSLTLKAYLGRFYIKSRIKEQLPVAPTLKQRLVQYVNAQHTETMMQHFYNAIFFAMPLHKPQREAIAKWGVSHLVALSGFHLGILWAVVYGLLWLFYRPIQQRYFPYRYALIDIGVVALVVLGLYVWFVNAPDSLVRAYAMVLAGWFALVAGVELLSFGLLALVVGVVLVLFPSLIFSVGFWFSVAGVFYIYLLLYHTADLPKWVVMLVVIPVGIFLLMLPVVHTIFPMASRCQLFSVVLSMLFTPFYPLSMLLHLLGMGGVFDGGLMQLFTLPCHIEQKLVPWWAGVGYLCLSFLAIGQKHYFYLLLATAVATAFWLYI